MEEMRETMATLRIENEVLRKRVEELERKAPGPIQEASKGRKERSSGKRKGGGGGE